MSDTTHESDAEELEESQTSEAQDQAREAKETHEAAEEKMKNLEDNDELPENLEDWPDDAAKYVTYGGAEGDHSYDEGPERKLGPSSLERHGDGSITIEGEKVDDPDEYRGEPIKGGPTDPEAPELPGERKKREKLAQERGDDPSDEGGEDRSGERGEGPSD